jgi:hypothetical protein
MNFWNNIGFGNVLTLVALLLSFWAAHRANVARIEKAADRIKDIEVKVQILYTWFERTWGTPGTPTAPQLSSAIQVDRLESEKRATEGKK